MARRTVGRSAAVNGISNVSALKMLNAARWLCGRLGECARCWPVRD